MEITLLILTLVLMIAVGVGLIILSLRLGKKPQDTSLLILQQQLGQLTQQVNDRLAQMASEVNTRLGEQTVVLQRTNENLGDRLDKATKVVGEVQHNLGRLEEASRQIFDVGKDIASLQQILKTPKLRGGLGEFFLGDLLHQVLPPEHYILQYAFKSKETVDAAICFEQGKVPVDAKFPLENFRRFMESTDESERKGARKAFIQDVKKHIDAIASKYIRPDEGTFDFALMYIPAENVYYETILRDTEKEERTLSDYALEKKVIPVSPNTFYAYLRAILLGLRGLRIEKEARMVFNSIKGLQQEFSKYRDDLALLGTHLSRAQNVFGNVEKRADRFGEKLEQAEHPTLPNPQADQPRESSQG